MCENLFFYHPNEALHSLKTGIVRAFLDRNAFTPSEETTPFWLGVMTNGETAILYESGGQVLLERDPMRIAAWDGIWLRIFGPPPCINVDMERTVPPKAGKWNRLRSKWHESCERWHAIHKAMDGVIELLLKGVVIELHGASVWDAMKDVLPSFDKSGKIIWTLSRRERMTFDYPFKFNVKDHYIFVPDLLSELANSDKALQERLMLLKILEKFGVPDYREKEFAEAAMITRLDAATKWTQT